MDKVNLSVIRKWVKMLESGSYRQAQRSLIKRKVGKRASYCCLGVLVRAQGGTFTQHGYPVVGGIQRDSPYRLNTDEVSAGIPEDVRGLLMDMNDEQGKSFKEIAQYIRKTYLSRKKKK